MATDTTHRKIALVVGPAYWGDPYLTRYGRPTPLRPPEVRARRRAEAATETRGLHLYLDALPPDCVLVVIAGSGGAANQAGLWANTAARQTIAVPVVVDSPELAIEVAVELVEAYAAAGAQVEVGVCALDSDDSTVEELTVGGLSAGAVLPAEPVEVADRKQHRVRPPDPTPENVL